MSNKANQKVMSDEEKEILVTQGQKARERKERVKESVRERKKELLTNYAETLPSVLDERLDTLATTLAKLDKDNQRISVAEIQSLLESPRAVGGYSADMLHIAFQHYKKMIVEANRFSKFPPSIKSFCAFLGVSTATYKNWLVDPDDEKREICLMVDDYLTDSMLTQAQRREVDAMTTMFRAKAEHGMIEPQAPQVIKVENNLNVNDILSNIESISGEKIILDAEFEEKEK